MDPDSSPTKINDELSCKSQEKPDGTQHILCTVKKGMQMLHA